jgi:hypothetical protein
MSQRTLTGGEADERHRPATLLYCDACDDSILRSNRYDHEHDLSDADAVECHKTKVSVEKVPEHAAVETQTYFVEYHYEVVEQVRVEAADKHDAREMASHKQTYDGELIETVHTRTRPHGSPSAATLEYLERARLLPDDHDISQADIERAIGAEDHE